MSEESRKDGLPLFLAFALSCKEIQLKKNPGLSSSFTFLEYCKKTGQTPNITIMERCFPIAIREYRECASCKESGYKADFSYESVLNHWQNHHGREGHCAVRKAVVLSFENDGGVWIYAENKTFAVKDPYGILDRGSDEDQGQNILIHQKTVIKKID
jgi:hypothetical protein